MSSPYNYGENKVTVVLDRALEVTTALRALGHLGVALGAHVGSSLLGRAELLDGAGVAYRGICRHPVVVLRAKKSHIVQAFQAANADSELQAVAFTHEMLETGHDDELARMMLDSETPILLGLIVFGSSTRVDPICRRFSLWR